MVRPSLSTSSSASGTATPPKYLPPHPDLFSIKAVAGGAYLGAISEQHIQQGQLVVAEAPLFTLDAPLQSYLYQRTILTGPGQGPTPVEGEEDEAEERARWEVEHDRQFDLEDWMERAIRVSILTKTEEQQKAFWELAATRTDMPETPGWNIFTTNAIS